MSLVGKLWDQINWLRRSSALRLSLLLTSVFAVGMAVAVIASLTLGRDALERRVDETLLAIASSTSVEDASNLGSEIVLREQDDLDGLPSPMRHAAQRGGGTVDLDRDFRRSDIWRVLITEDVDGEPVMIALSMEESAQAQEDLSGWLWTTAIIIIGVALAIGLITGLFAQRRLKVIDQTLTALASGDLAARTGRETANDDLDYIATQVDDTAAKLERLVVQTRHLSASIAHDLRTPLARLRARLEMLPEGEARGDALEEANRLSEIFDTIMRVARIEAAHGQDGIVQIDTQELLQELEEIFGPVVEDESKALRLQVQSPSHIQADRQMIIQAMANLIQNALVHGGDTITLIADGPSIGVADNGDGIDPSQYDEVIKPMVRLDAARTSDGSGLGLALVRAVTERHGAKLVLSENTPSGLKVMMNFAKL